MWDSILKFKDLVLQEVRLEFSLVDKEKSIVKVSVQAALDAADSAARSMASAMAVHRSSRLQSSGLLLEVQQTLQDLPFKGVLLLEHMNVKLHGLKDSRVTLKSLGLYTPMTLRKYYRPQEPTCFSTALSRHNLQRKGSRGFRHRQPPVYLSGNICPAQTSRGL